jgi:hypothetical protein
MSEWFYCLICKEESSTLKDAQFHAENCPVSNLNRKIKELEERITKLEEVK